MRYLSLFSGIGGFELGIEQAYESNNRQKQQRRGSVVQNSHDNSNGIFGESVPICVGFSEIDKYATTVYRKHFSDHKNYGDITKIDERGLPPFDLICGGFPCQSFSIAGKRGGFEDTRGTLFFHIARIIKHNRPRFIFLENVKGLLSHDGGRTFNTIITTLEELGYDLQWQVLNSKDFGVPQNRERVFIVGHSRGSSRPKIFPVGEGGQFDGEVRETQDQKGSRSSCLSTRYGQRWTDETYIGTFRTHKDGQGFRKSESGLSPTIPARAREDGSDQPVIVQRPRGKNKGGNHKIAPTMTGSSYQDNNHVSGIRRLTPVECERLQGFPDNWTAEVSDTQRYKCLGNAVTVNVIEYIISQLIKTS